MSKKKKKALFYILRALSAPPKHKNKHTAMELILFFQLHCYNAHLSMDVHCNLELKKKKKKRKIPNRIKIIFVAHRASLCLLSLLCVSLSHLLSKLSQAHSFKLSPLCFTSSNGPTHPQCHRHQSSISSTHQPSQAADQRRWVAGFVGIGGLWCG